MKLLTAACLFVLLFTSGGCFVERPRPRPVVVERVYVEGYHRPDGIWIPGHYR